MEFVIRRAALEDADALGRVHVQSWKTTYQGIVPAEYIASLDMQVRADRWREQIARGDSITFVAEDREGIFGFVSGGCLRKPIDDYDGELYAIYLLSERQGQGVGRKLVARLAEVLHDEGFAKMAVWVLKANPAVGFYRRLGGLQISEAVIEIGGARLEELAFGWPSINDLLCGPVS